MFALYVFLIVVADVAQALVAESKTCSCANVTLCEPLSTASAKREVFAFYVSNDTWPDLDFSTMTTACAFTQVDPALVCHAHKLGVRVVKSAPFPISSIQNASARTVWVQEQLASLQNQGLDGLNLDIEGYTGMPGPLTALVTELHSALKKWHPHSQLSFDLAIFPDGQSQHYDHKALAEVLDFIVPMAYDEPWGSHVAAANSPIRNINAGIAQYAKLGVPASKLVIGLPWYGWDYPCVAKEGECVVKPPAGSPWYGWATQVGYSNVIKQLHAGGGPVSMDTATVTKHFDYMVSGGKSPGRHQLWFDDPDTLEAKYAACQRAGARGVGFWTADMPDYPDGEGRPMWAAINKGFPPSAEPISP